MPMQKPKSAPSRLRSRFAANKTNAIKEIEAWVKKDADPLFSGHEASRMSGQLTDNITEERMLKSKLWELSKERYKFLSQSAYEKKMFTDRIQRKSSAIKRQMEQQQQRSRKYSGCYDDSSDAVSVRSEKSGSVAGKKKRVNARLALLERMDPKKRGDRPKEVKAMAEDPGSNRAVRFKPTLVTETGRTYTTTTSASTVTVGSGTPSLPLMPTSTSTSTASTSATPYGMASPSMLPSEGNPARLTVPPRQGSASGSRLLQRDREEADRTEPREPPHSAPPLKSQPLRSWSAGNKPPEAAASPSQLPLANDREARAGPGAAMQPWARWRSSRYGNIKLQSMTGDPRYFRLENALSPIFKPSQPDRDVHDIVKRITSLHVPPRMPKDAKPKIELKVIDFMRQRGFVF